MKNKKIQDERIITSKRKIQSDGFNIIWFVLLISVLIQQHLYNADFVQYAVELVVFILMSIYVIIANISIGNDIFSSKKGNQRTIFINSLVTGITVSVINTAINYMKYGDNIQESASTHIILVAGITFISSALLAFITLEVFNLINQKKQEAIDKKLDHDDII